MHGCSLPDVVTGLMLHSGRRFIKLPLRDHDMVNNHVFASIRINVNSTVIHITSKLPVIVTVFIDVHKFDFFGLINSHAKRLLHH